MTPAERQRAYRRRQQRAEIDSLGAEADASRVTLLGSLAHALAQLDTDRPADQQAATRWTASRIIQEIVTRYDIDLPMAAPVASGDRGGTRRGLAQPSASLSAAQPRKVTPRAQGATPQDSPSTTQSDRPRKARKMT